MSPCKNFGGEGVLGYEHEENIPLFSKTFYIAYYSHHPVKLVRKLFLDIQPLQVSATRDPNTRQRPHSSPNPLAISM